MNWMQDIDTVLSLVLAFWGVAALIGGPILFYKARKFFPERREAITPEQLRAELATFDKNLREAFNSEIGRLRLSHDEQHREIIDRLREALTRAEGAREIATQALGKAALVEERVNGLDLRLIDRMQRLEESLSQLRQVRRGEG